MSGASGSVIGIRLLEVLRDLHIETHLVITKWAEATLHLETQQPIKEIRSLASTVHSIGNQASPIASGSYPTEGLIIAPLVMKNLKHVLYGLPSDLLCHAANL